MSINKATLKFTPFEWVLKPVISKGRHATYAWLFLELRITYNY